MPMQVNKDTYQIAAARWLLLKYRDLTEVLLNYLKFIALFYNHICNAMIASPNK